MLGTEFIRDANTMPPIAVSTPMIMKQEVMIRCGFKPASLAASWLPPIA